MRAMWTWLVFVVSSVSCAHLVYELVKSTRGNASNPMRFQER